MSTSKRRTAREPVSAESAYADADSTPAVLGYRMPAEWEPHAATWLAWPHEKTDWPGKFEAVHWVFCEIARALTAAWEGGADPGLAGHVRRNYLWTEVARRTAEVYDQVAP